MNEAENGNYDVFRDCVSAAILHKSKQGSPAKQIKKRRRIRDDRRFSQTLHLATAPSSTSSEAAADDGSYPVESGAGAGGTTDDPAELSDFINYLATEIFTSLPTEVRFLSYHFLQSANDAALSEKYHEPLSATVLETLVQTVPPSVPDTLTAYGILDPPASDLHSFLLPVLSAYISTITAPPPPWISTRTAACEICERDWVPLTYHHLIPRGIHAKVLKRGWHEEHRLNSVAWLCRACHNFVHSMAGNEELARKWYSVELIMEREDAGRWAKWVGGVRWKKR